MNLSEEIFKMQSYQLFAAFEEISKFQGSGILIDGHVRNLSRKMAEMCGEPVGNFIKLVCDAFLFEMARRYYEGMKI